MYTQNSDFQSVDTVIESFKTTQNLNAQWSQFTKVIISYIKTETNKRDSTDALFQENLPFEHRRLIALCILRVFNLNPKSISYDTSFKVKTFKLFDVTLSDIYKQSKISINSQGYEKESHLSSFINEIDSKIKNSLLLHSLTELESYEGRYKRLLNETLNGDINKFFLQDANADNSLSKACAAIKKYMQCTTNEKMAQFNKAKKDISSLIEACSEYDTKYSNLLIKSPLDRILELLKEDFNNYPISKPAELSLNMTGKKYPFLSKGDAFPINVEIQNSGKGQAYEAKLTIENCNEEIIFESKEVYIGTITTDKTTRNLICKVVTPEEIAFLALSISWKDFSGESRSKTFDFEISSQTTEIDWDKLKYEQPYSLKPVENEDELVGRKEKLNELIALCRNSDSCFVAGQKRVGKTSLVKILKEKLKQDESLKILPILVMLQTEINDTISTLVERICKQIKLSDFKLSNLEIPISNNSFGKIYDFLLEVLMILDGHKIVIMIDEFDQLPQNLYKRGEVGDSFFLAIKNLSTESRISFILIGGERMAFIKNVQAVHLNLFKTISLDYFDAEKSWVDFEELVRHPVRKYFEIETDAIQHIYQYTLGHPFFTKKICQELYNICVNNHDSHITKEEMNQAIVQAISSSDITDFAHFWDDGIMEKGNTQEEISLLRRKVFLSLVESHEKNSGNNGYSVNKFGIPESDFNKLLNELIVRQIVYESSKGLRFRVKFFYEWLKRFGKEKIFTTPVDEQGISERKMIEELSRVKSEEILQLVRNWGPYCGKEVTTDKVRAWLNQFGGNMVDQRLMFMLLQNITFFNNNTIRANLTDIFKTIIRALARERFERFIDNSKRKRDDIFVSHLESSLTKSGAEYAKIFADENNLYAENSISKDKLLEKLRVSNSVRALIFVDDFSGTGDSICKNIKEVFEIIEEIVVQKKILIFITVICGFESAKSKIQKLTKSYPKINIHINFTKILDDSNKCFNDYSKIFSSKSEKDNAKSICLEYGQKLEPDHPLGYGNSQALIVFPNACPNNTLPIFWKETDSWMPLFKRI